MHNCVLQMAACAADRDQGPKRLLQRLSDGFTSVKGGQDRTWRGLIRILDRAPTWMHDDGVMDLPRVASCACRSVHWVFDVVGNGIDQRECKKLLCWEIGVLFPVQLGVRGMQVRSGEGLML